MKKQTLTFLLILSVGIVGLPIVNSNAADGDFSGFHYSVGTYFEINDSPYLNITLLSTEVVRVLLRTGPQIVSFAIENNSSATSTTLTFRGLGANRTYSQYEDGYLIDTFTTDLEGEYTFAQELLEAHHITIQERQSTIYIRSDGTISPTTAPLSVDGNIYTFTNNIYYESIVIQKDNIVLDGNGYTLQGPGAWSGVGLSGRSNVIVRNVVARDWWDAISIWYSHAIEIRNNEVLDNTDIGILLVKSDSNRITDNIVKRGVVGIAPVWDSNLNLIVGNDIEDQRFAGTYPYFACSGNQFYHNNFINNYRHVYNWGGEINVWDDGYPSGGNYWSGISKADAYHGPNQNEIGSDGIGDTSYVIDANNIDHYPLKNCWEPIETRVQIAGNKYGVTIVSNASVGHIVATKNSLHFETSGPGGDAYINAVFPMANTTAIRIFVDGAKLTPPPFPVIHTNGTHYFIYFEFALSTRTITLQFAPVSATLDVAPDAFNLISQGEWITAYVELPQGYDVADIDVPTFLLNDTIPVDVNETSTVGDEDGDGIPDLMVKFDRAAVASYIEANVNMTRLAIEKFMTVTLTVTGELSDGTPFEGSDLITIIYPPLMGAGPENRWFIL